LIGAGGSAIPLLALRAFAPVASRAGVVRRGGMTELVLAAIFLPVSHFGISSTPLRPALVARIGERAYLGLYSLVTAGAFFWLVRGYRAADTELLWLAPAPVRWLAIAVITLGLGLAVVGVLTPNPTTVGAEALFDRPGVASGVVRITRNPFLWGVGLWALAHLVVGGDVASLLLFLSVGSLGLVGAPLLDAKKAGQHPERWRAFAAETSSVPFLAIAQGRQRLALGEIGLWRIAVALVVLAALFLAHEWLFGVSPLAGL
jgi:uncharacterized membrane protein